MAILIVERLLWRSRLILIFDKAIVPKLLENGSEANHAKDHFPLLHITLMGTHFNWLITELKPESPNIAYGIFNDETGFHEGEINLDLLSNKVGPDCNGKGYSFIFTKEELAAPIPCQQIFFEAQCPLSVYRAMAEEFGCIITGEKDNWEIWRRHTNNWKKKNI